MAFSFGNSVNALGGGATGAGGSSSGPDLETIQTEALGFLSVAGDAKVRLTSPWSQLPSATSSLLSIASQKGLVAAAGPDHIILATTESVRKAFESPKDGDSDVRSFTPQLKLPMPMRVSQLAFTADENYLILSAETGGGLAVYDVQSLLQGSSNSAFELSTNGEPLRALVPNPTPERAELCAIVTNSGNLHIANLKDRVVSNPLKNQVSCLSWSAKGKQLCAGLGNGTIYQVTPEGQAKDEIPKPPGLGDCHVSSITWLENNVFLAIHSTSSTSPPSSIYHIITREPPSSFKFQKVTDPVEPFGSDKIPHHTILRLRDFPPDIQDLLIVSSTASTELGLLSRSKAPLATDKPADSITNVFTTTELLDDTKRPTLPMTDSMDDSTPVGVALDLSSKDKVYKPIPSDEELEDSPSPLPGLWVLTHEGVLCSWWVIYTDSIKKGTAYPGLAAVKGIVAAAAPALAPSAFQPAQTASVSPFSNTGPSAFGSSIPAAGGSAFGSAGQLGQKTSPWGAPATATPSNTGGATFGSSTFGSSPAPTTPAFGKPSTIGFGQSSQVGIRTSPWAAVGGAAPAFGQSGFSSFASASGDKSPFGSPSAPNPTPSAAPASGGFAGFAKSGGFGSVAPSNNGSSIFGNSNKPAANPFASTSNTTSSAATAFPPKPQSNAPGGAFGSSTPFKLESSFKPDPSQAEPREKAPVTSGSSLFGSAFGSALTDAGSKPSISTPLVKDEDMETADSTEKTPQPQPQPKSLFAPQGTPESTTPTTTPAPGRFGFAPSPAPGTSLFGQPTKLGSSTAGNLFGSKQESPRPNPFATTFSQSKDAPNPFAQSIVQEPTTPKIKLEEQEAPLPPDTTSKMSYPLGESSSSSATSNISSQHYEATTTPAKSDSTSTLKGFNVPEDSPLPPDFITSSKSSDAPLPPDFVNVRKPVETKEADDAPLPPDFTKSNKTTVPDAPLPPDPVTSKAKPNDAPLPPDFVLPPAPSKETSTIPSVPDNEDESDEGSGLSEDNASDEGNDLSEEDNGSDEGSGIDVAKDLSPSTTGFTHTPGFTPQSSFGGPGAAHLEHERSRPLFGEVSRNAPLFPRPTAASPRSPSPLRAIPNRVIRADASRSVSAPGMASQILGPQKPQSHLGASIISRERQTNMEDQFMQQHRKIKARQEAEEAQPLVDEEDDEVQKVLASEVEGALELDEFIAHSNIVPPAKESVPSQVEAVYRDINSMIDTLGLNLRAVKAFTKGHTENGQEEGRTKDDLEIPDDWVLCEINELGDLLDNELYVDLEDGQVQGLEGKIEECQDLARDMHRLRAKQEDLKRVVMARMDPDQADLARSLPLSAEQAAQQNELRREIARFTKLLTETEEALTLLKTRIASSSSSSGRGSSNVPTVEAVIRTISKMTTMVEKRSGDIDMLESQMRKVRLGSTSREGSPMVTPQARRSVMFSPESTPSRNFRQSFSSSVLSPAKATPPRKKLSGFSKEEKGDLMERRARRQGVLSKLKDSVEKKGVNVWNMEDIE